jgi:hypothetical protein
MDDVSNLVDFDKLKFACITSIYLLNQSIEDLDPAEVSDLQN